MKKNPLLGAALLSSPPSTALKIELPKQALLELPERAVQFGTGGFLRGFIEYFLDSANRRGDFNGRVVAIGSTPSGRTDTLMSQDGLFTLVTEGIEHGKGTRTFRVISSLSRSLSAETEWGKVLEVARDPEIGFVFSNTTEIGIVDDESANPGKSTPRSFPGKLTAFLLERATHFNFDRTRGLIVVPCELIERNGETLCGIVKSIATRWSVDPDFLPWLNESVIFCDTLVDRIVTGNPTHQKRGALCRELGYEDSLLTVCEPYKLFAIQAPNGAGSPLSFFKADPGIVTTDDVTPYRARKVRILNGAHSIMAPLGLLAGKNTVFEAMNDVRIRGFIEELIFSEIVPGVDAPEANEFAREVMFRFSNPYLEHSLLDITLHGTRKIAVRIVPSIVDHYGEFGRCPELLSFGFAAYLAFMRGDLHLQRERAGLAVPADTAGLRVRAAWDGVENLDDLTPVVDRVLGQESLWQANLRRLDGFAAALNQDLQLIMREGILAALESKLEPMLSASLRVQ